ncbi:hypothetical protein V6N11_050199 [Hibiscus sabdariffa]|uniref:DUF4219 domain-containing protein n=1 Tax=Hibiscus sabdariffa TaxID=183260 RepID=A0ABR2T958_9ROSI
MASNSTSFSMEEGQSISKPPFFNGANYPYWKNRIMLFIQSTDYMIWDVVLDGPFTPVKREGDTLVPKQRHEWNDEKRRIFQMNAKAMHILFCALGPDEYAKISSCSSAKEIWDKLEVTHEGTSEVKETKIGLLNLSYENFKMELDEDIKKMFDRFSVIVNGLKGYGEIIPEDKLVRKLIYSFLESWDSKKTVIIEAKNLKTLKLDEIMGSLLTHELMKQGKRDEEKKKEEKKEKPEHIRTECPQLKKKSFGKKKKLKSHVATWSDKESLDEDEEKVANLCLMALDDEPKVTSSSSLFDLSYNELLDELQEVYDELVGKYKESILKNKKIILDLKNERDSLYEINHELESKMRDMQSKLKDFEKKNQDLHGLLSKVKEGRQKEVDDLKASLNKVGKTSFENASASRTNHVRRNYNNYKQRGFQKTYRSKRVRSGWVPKDLITSNNIHAIAS